MLLVLTICQHCSKWYKCVASFSPYNNLMKLHSNLISIVSVRKLRHGKVKWLPKVTELIIGRGRIQTEPVWLQSKKPTSCAKKKDLRLKYIYPIYLEPLLCHVFKVFLCPLATCLRGQFARYAYFHRSPWSPFDSTFVWKRGFGGRELGEQVSFTKHHIYSLLPLISWSSLE